MVSNQPEDKCQFNNCRSCVIHETLATLYGFTSTINSKVHDFPNNKWLHAQEHILPLRRPGDRQFSRLRSWQPIDWRIQNFACKAAAREDTKPFQANIRRAVSFWVHLPSSEDGSLMCVLSTITVKCTFVSYNCLFAGVIARFRAEEAMCKQFCALGALDCLLV